MLKLNCKFVFDTSSVIEIVNQIGEEHIKQISEEGGKILIEKIKEYLRGKKSWLGRQVKALETLSEKDKSFKKELEIYTKVLEGFDKYVNAIKLVPKKKGFDIIIERGRYKGMPYAMIGRVIEYGLGGVIPPMPHWRLFRKIIC